MRKLKNIKIFEDLIKDLKDIESKDQNIRNEVDEWYKNNTKQNIDKNLLKRWEQIDKENLEKIEIILKDGYPSKDIVGSENSLIPWLIIQHSDLEIMKKYLPILILAVEKGDIEKQHYALTIDRILMYEKLPQIYGSQLILENRKYVVYDLLDPINVNVKRNEVGLEPLEDYIKSFN